MSIRPLILALSLLIPACSGAPLDETDDDMNFPVFDDAYTGPLHEDDFERRARGAGAPVPSKVVQPIEPRTGPWSGNSQLGQTQEFATTEDNRQSIIKLDEWGMPQVWSVMLGISYDKDWTSTAGMGLTAVIELGVGGSSQTVEVDWKEGTVITAPMNALNVVAKYDLLDESEAPQDLRLTVTMAQGSVEHGAPTKTVITETVASGPVQLIVGEPIPAMATSLMPMLQGFSTGFYSASYSIYFLRSEQALGNIVAVIDGGDILSMMAGGGIPIPSAARYFKVIQNVGGPGDTVHCIFPLAL